ncbi:BTAD domain-containing putative transcriptional regulator [Streptomyces yaanensis]|uniref:BTAD domain-containing putative transcriptional regulator n=1 Tax=Streptomyces yaanensis TaxID=1142239 RepID=A0ABV7SGQ8_9ACTN|nr:BTAD domain-containing putative transcriptional regulator [Streptomyces sp. CGMCC 4.7035]WNB98017.1 BTAD domain-containing putative transcriptional regulator [Streptomyces sp. CGMCC 4.7035]
MRFGILGPLDVRTEDDTPLDPGGPRPRALLTLLLLDAGRTVSLERLTDGLYGEEPPAGAANALQSQISRLRKRLSPHTDIEATPTGYRLPVAPDTVDAHRFERLAREGSSALAHGDHRGAAAALREALALWRGPALADLPAAQAQRTRLEELRLAAVQDRVEADLALGSGAGLIPELRELLAAHPLSERLYELLMRALHAGGRPAEALTVYEEARRTLADELGTDPSPELSALHQELLRGTGPAQGARLPAQLTRFIGRAPELARIDAFLAAPDTRLVTLTGPGGAGKTRLATEAARRYAEGRAGAHAGADVNATADAEPRTRTASAAHAHIGTASAAHAHARAASAAHDRARAASHAAPRGGTASTADIRTNPSDARANAPTHAHAAAPDVRLVELAPVTDGSRIPYAVLAALGVRDGFRGPATDATERLLAALEDRELLLVLDNCEHVVEDAARIAALVLGSCPGVRILATGREALGITGEVLCPVPPLPPEHAVRLFLDRARAVRPGFEGHARVEDVCAALDGLPLAIELAAARLRTLTPDELADRLGDRFRLLSRGDRTKAPRHRTLRAVVEWSWDLLDEEERELARRLSVFSGGATLDAVEAVCGVPYPEDLLASLAEKSFLEVADGRHRMLETIRAFATERLVEAGEQERLRDAHAAYYRGLAERAEPYLRSGEQLPWLARLTAEHGNLDAALRHLVSTAPRDALRLMAHLSWFWRLRGPHGEQEPVARALLAAVGDEPPEGLAEEYALCAMNTITGRGDDPAGPGRIARVAEVIRSLDRPLRLPFVMVLWALTGGPLLSADTELRAVQLGDDPWGSALLDLGSAYQAQFAGSPAASEAGFARALTGFRASGDRWGMANCLDPLGAFADWRGEHERALELLDEGLTHVRELDAPEETADLLRSKAVVLLHRGDVEAAAAYFEQSAALARAAGVPDKVASARRGLGDLARLSGDTAHARVQYEKALQTCAANWFSVGESVRILIGLGRTAAAEGRAEEARDWFGQAARLAAEGPGVLELAETAEALASVAESPERAAVLLGAGTALRGAPLLGDPDVVRTREATRERLSPEAYEEAFDQGRRLRSAAVSER